MEVSKRVDLLMLIAARLTSSHLSSPQLSVNMRAAAAFPLPFGVDLWVAGPYRQPSTR
jgi:hypothetical protein